jgi:DNA-binding IclR family transcriptional regulator
VAGTTRQIGIDRVAVLAREVKQAALEISTRLGYVEKRSGVA